MNKISCRTVDLMTIFRASTMELFSGVSGGDQVLLLWSDLGQSPEQLQSVVESLQTRGSKYVMLPSNWSILVNTDF